MPALKPSVRPMIDERERLAGRQEPSVLVDELQVRQVEGTHGFGRRVVEEPGEIDVGLAAHEQPLDGHRVHSQQRRELGGVPSCVLHEVRVKDD